MKQENDNAVEYDPLGDDIEVLYPQQVIPIAGHSVIVNEITFMQGLKLTQVVAPMIGDLDALFQHPDEVSLSALHQVFANHQNSMLELMALCSSLSVEKIQKLRDSDGQLLMTTFWNVNKGFFLNRLVTRKADREARQGLPTQDAPPHKTPAPSAPRNSPKH